MHAFSPEFARIKFCVSFDPESYGHTAARLPKRTVWKEKEELGTHVTLARSAPAASGTLMT